MEEQLQIILKFHSLLNAEKFKCKGDVLVRYLVHPHPLVSHGYCVDLGLYMEILRDIYAAKIIYLDRKKSGI
ncbi:hypothetical protein XELAEV_18003893mg [Xenopus laevis]|uniref:Uncharacterized protein n=1 Tax=Xenopus laevis TaxID=8355 RepID=A0A974BNT1_XENLA|nr:hypothetical protein XELAEV_18003893mg [Xenopus laevis]